MGVPEFTIRLLEQHGGVAGTTFTFPLLVAGVVSRFRFRLIIALLLSLGLRCLLFRYTHVSTLHGSVSEP